MRLLKRFLLLLATGGTTVLLSACYGTIVPLSASGNVNLTVDNTNGEPINNILCQMKTISSDSVYIEGRTDTNGQVKLVYSDINPDSYKLVLTDTDGTNSGGDYQTLVEYDIYKTTFELTNK